MILYGIPGCDTCRTALRELQSAGLSAQLRDVRAQPLTQAEIAEIVAAFGARAVNCASTTWRGLGPVDRALDPAALIAAYPAVMKRPVISVDGTLFLGWGPEVRAHLLK